MNQFSQYLLGSWGEGGLTIRDKPASKAPAVVKRGQPWHTALVVSAIAFGFSTISGIGSEAQAALSWHTGKPKFFAVSPTSGEERVPRGYWRLLMSEIREWPMIDDKSLSDFDSIIK